MPEPKTYTYLFSVLFHVNGEHVRLHLDERCKFAACLMGYDIKLFRSTSCKYDDDRCTACGGLLKGKPKR